MNDRLDILSDYPQTEAILRSYDEQAGKCICCQRLFDPLKVVIEEYRLDGEGLLSKLNAVEQNKRVDRLKTIFQVAIIVLS